MKYIINIIILALFVNSTVGQVATIKDKDGWTNVREEPNGESDSLLKIYENEVFWYNIENLENGKDWIEVYIPKNDYSFGCSENNETQGFIHKSRLLPIEKMTIPENDEIFFKYALTEFKESNHIIGWQDEQWISEINGRPAWGIDGNMPKTEITGITAKIGENDIDIGKVFFQDIFECSNDFKIYKNEGCYFIHQWNSDGAGGYEIVWVINKNGLKQRLVGTVV